VNPRNTCTGYFVWFHDGNKAAQHCLGDDRIDEFGIGDDCVRNAMPASVAALAISDV
jgi:hypothetical protein